MLPGATVPRSLTDLLAVFRPCFTTPTFPTFVGLLVGLIAQTRRRTVCGMVTGAGLDQVWHHSRAHRLFTNAQRPVPRIAVGTALTGGPPRRSQRAGLPHWAPASGSGVEAHGR